MIPWARSEGNQKTQRHGLAAMRLAKLSAIARVLSSAVTSPCRATCVVHICLVLYMPSTVFSSDSITSTAVVSPANCTRSDAGRQA